MLLRAKDRLSDDFADAPRRRASSPAASGPRGTSTRIGRAERLGLPVRRQRELYDFRLQHGFTDVADAAFERLLERRHR